MFSTGDQLLPGDDKHFMDVFELRDGKTLRLLTPGPAAVPGQSHISTLQGLSRDGSRVIIETTHAYSPLDVEIDFYPYDTYVLENGRWSLVSGPSDSSLQHMTGYTADARHVYFWTSAGIAPNDTDEDIDLYEWDQGTIRMVSTGPSERTEPQRPNYSYGVSFGGASDDGSEVFFVAGDQLVPEAKDPDEGVEPNVYVRRNASVTEFIDVPGDTVGYWSPNTFVSGVSHDGSRVYFTTNVQIVPEDTDATPDAYLRTRDGAWTLLSQGSIGGNDEGPECNTLPPGSPPGPCGAGYAAASRSGHRVFFVSNERLVPQDTDSSWDIYERAGSTTTLITPDTEDHPSPMSYVRAPKLEAVSDDGSQVALTSWSQLVPADKDKRPDIYVRTGGRYHLISTGPAERGGRFDPVFADFVDGGGSVIFWTRAPLVAADKDNDPDVYERVMFVGPQGKGASAAGKGKKKKRKRATGKTRLLSAERIPPRIRLSRRGRVSNGTAQVRIGCPKKETSGGCKGSAKVLGGGKGGFRLKRGRSAWVAVGSAGSVGNAATVVVRGKDLLGNKAKVRKRVSF